MDPQSLIEMLLDPLVVRVNAGSKVGSVDSKNNTWGPDNYFTNGKAYVVAACPDDFAKDKDLYCTERHGALSYSFPVKRPGFYTVRLHFAEVYCEYNTI